MFCRPIRINDPRHEKCSTHFESWKNVLKTFGFLNFSDTKLKIFIMQIIFLIKQIIL